MSDSQAANLGDPHYRRQKNMWHKLRRPRFCQNCGDPLRDVAILQEAESGEAWLDRKCSRLFTTPRRVFDLDSGREIRE